jgi:hypothetical protein
MNEGMKNLTQIEAMGLAGNAIDSIANGNIHSAWNYLNRAIGLVDELIEDIDDNDEV